MVPSKLNDHVKNTCRLGQGAECCKYLSVSESGFNCEKLTDLGRQIEMLTGMTAKADNCDGIPEIDWEKKLNRLSLEIVM